MRVNRSKTAISTFCLTVAAAVGFSTAGLLAQPSEATRHEPASASGAEASPAARYFPDTVLVNQDGEEMRFYSDLLRGKVVVINTIFTTCTGICPVMSKTYARLQDHLGDRLGRDVHLISISVDPENDTPQRLKAFAEAFGAREGWYLLTGEKANVNHVLYKLGQFVEAKENHTAIMLMGNEPTGLWKKAFGLAESKELAAILDSVLEDSFAAQTVH